ncbi:MAG: hypothetical protein IT381_11015 [Deltaproteobacteria bacterium]|nr:hypothetical protein [Deltaproteobacteria bacterium]
MAEREGSLELTLNGQATARMLVVAFVIGGAVAAAVLAALKNALQIGEPLPRQIAMGSPYYTLFFWCGTVIAAASYAIVKLRQPKGARIAWNDWGVVEWDGDAVRCAIEREKLRVGSLTTAVAVRGLKGAAAQAALGREKLGGAIGKVFTLGDDDGRRIYVGEGVQLAWLNDRLSTVGDTEALRAYAAECAGMPPEIGRSAENRLAGIWALAIGSYVCALLGAMMILAGKTTEPAALAFIAGAALFAFFRALVVWVRARRVAKAGRHFTERVTITGNDGPLLLVQGAGAAFSLDPRSWKHPDAALFTRRGEAWIAKDRSDLETSAARQARRHRLRSLRLEFLGRALFFVALVVLGAAVYNGFERWELSVAGLSTKTEVAFLDRWFARMTPAGAEIAYHLGKTPIGINGTPEIFAAGPDGTLAFQANGQLVFRTVSLEGSNYNVRAKSPLPRARFVAADKDDVFIATDGGGELWRKLSIDVVPIAQIVLADVSAATFSDEALFLGTSAGKVHVYSRDKGAALETLASDGPITALAAGASGIAAIDAEGITFFSASDRRRLGRFPARDVREVRPGYYPDWLHQAHSGFLVLGQKTVRAVQANGTARRELKLPPGVDVVHLNGNSREMQAATADGALYTLWIH